MASFDEDPWNSGDDKPSGVMKWTLGVVVVTLAASAFFVFAFTGSSDIAAVVERFEAGAPSSAPAAQTAGRTGQGHRELSYKATSNGHFIVDASINGTEISLLFDSGASTVALSPADAERLGIRRQQLRFTLRYETANGVVQAAPVTLDRIRLGQLVYYDVAATVIDAPMSISLLGMSFLERLDGFEVAGGRLTLRW